MENDEGRAPLGSWRAFHSLVLTILLALIVLFSLLSWQFS